MKVLLPERMGCSKPPLRQEFQMAEMSPLRRRMIEDMTIRNLSPATQQSYLYAVSQLRTPSSTARAETAPARRGTSR